jgi:hypothetical protein
LKHYGFISYERISELFSEVFEINLSQGTLVNFINEYAERVEPVVEKIQETLKNAEVLHCDESGMRIEKSTAWLHSASTESLSFYYPHKNRGIKVEVLELNVREDHIHMVVVIPPKISISELMGTLKGKTAITLFKSYHEVNNHLQKRWLFTYFYFTSAT